MRRVVVFIFFPLLFVFGFVFIVALIAFVQCILLCVCVFCVHCSTCGVYAYAAFLRYICSKTSRKISLFTETHRNLFCCLHGCVFVFVIVCESMSECECNTICAESITRRYYRWIQYCCCWRYCNGVQLENELNIVWAFRIGRLAGSLQCCSSK